MPSTKESKTSVSINPRFCAYVRTLVGLSLPKQIAQTFVDEKDGLKILRLSIVALAAGAGGTETVFRITDGITPIDVSLPTGDTIADIFLSQIYPAGSTLAVFVQSDDNVTPPLDINLIAEYTNPAAFVDQAPLP